MQTVFDWLSVALFAAIAVLFLHRSTAAERRGDHILLYLPPTVLCALANGAGNAGYAVVACGLLLLAMIYVVVVLRPGRPPRERP